MTRVLRYGRSGTYVVEAQGKAQRSMRRIKLDPETAAIVRRRCYGKKADEFVFERGERQWSHHLFRQSLERVREDAGLPNITAHWFRHTHVAWMAMSGAPLPELQRRIGHANISTTIDVYGGMIGDVQDATIDAFSRMRASSLAVAPQQPAATIEGSTISQ